MDYMACLGRFWFQHDVKRAFRLPVGMIAVLPDRTVSLSGDAHMNMLGWIRFKAIPAQAVREDGSAHLVRMAFAGDFRLELEHGIGNGCTVATG